MIQKYIYSSCILACLYGILIKNTQLIIVNVVGVVLEALYLIFYLFYTLNKVIYSLVQLLILF